MFALIVWCCVLCSSNNRRYIVNSNKLETIDGLPAGDLDILPGNILIWTPKKAPFEVKVLNIAGMLH